MSVSTYIALNPGAKVAAVHKVAGILLGLPVSRTPIGDGQGVEVQGLLTQPVGIGLVNLCFMGPMVHGGTSFFFTYQFEYESGVPGATGIGFDSNALGIALGERLIEFFGGTIEYDASKEHGGPDRIVQDGVWRHGADNDTWQANQDAIAAVKPLTKKDLKAAKALAFYQR